MTDHLNSPEPHRSPYAHMSDDEVVTAYERVAADPDNIDAAPILAELQHRGVATASSPATAEDELIDKLGDLA